MSEHKFSAVREKIRHISIYKKILVIFLLILILIGIFCTGIYLQGRSLIKDEISKVISEQNHNMTNYLESECRKIRMMQYQLVKSSDIIDLLVARVQQEGEKERSAIHEIQDSLATIWQCNRLIEEVEVIIPSIDLVINTGTSFSMDEKMKKLMDDYGGLTPGNLVEYEDQLIQISDYLGSEYYVCTRLDKQSVITYMNQMSGSKIGTYLLYDLKTGKTIGNEIEPQIKDILQEMKEKSSIPEMTEKGGYLIQIMPVADTAYSCVAYVDNKDVYRNLNKYKNIYILLLGVLFISGIWFLKKMFSMIHRPLQVLVHGLEGVSEGNLDERIAYNRYDEFQYIYSRFNNMTIQLKSLIDKNYKQEILLQKAELKQLQTQISPHFLYNSFIVLSNRINAEDYEFASDFSRQLGQYFMFITRNGREYLPLREELDHANTYINIQHTRFRNRFSMQIDELADCYQKITVPRLIIQPVFENVFKYVVERTRDEIFLHMGFKQEEDILDIYIENSGEITDSELETMRESLEVTEGEIHGMANIHHRLKIIYRGEGGILLSRSGYGGLKVTIRIKMEIPEGK